MNKKWRVPACVLVPLLVFISVGNRIVLAQPPEVVIESIISSAKFQQAADFFEADHDQFVSDLTYLTQIPAPPFQEVERAEAYMEMLQEHGLSEVRTDAEGNVMGVRKGVGNGSMLAVLAHLDTVFPEGTDVQVRREGTRLYAPGVGDATRGLSFILAMIRAMDSAAIETESDILFVGDVGEEGIGDLRGVKYLFSEGQYRDQINQFITIDGPADADGEWSIQTSGVGSIRYRFDFRGPGGHSFEDFGYVNPANAMAFAIGRIPDISVPDDPKTTHNIGVVSGGTSVNSIPVEVSMQVDMRSESSAELDRLHEMVLASIQEAVDEENARGSTSEGVIEVDPVVIGDRPAGETSRNSRIVQIAVAAVEHYGFEPNFRAFSSDANLPMSLGIPAIGITPGQVYRAHSLDEWTDIDKELTVQAESLVLAMLLGLAGVPE